MIVVATTEDELAGMCNRLRALGVHLVDVVAPSDTRRVVLASAEDAAGAAGLVVSLRAEGVMAVTRPDGGAALEAWHRDTRPVTFGERLSVCLAWSEHDRRHLPGLIELGPGGFGSGHHPTTSQIIEELAGRVVGGERVLDVGCGSGILGLCALRLGAAGVVAADIELDAMHTSTVWAAAWRRRSILWAGSTALSTSSWPTSPGRESSNSPGTWSRMYRGVDGSSWAGSLRRSARRSSTSFTP